MLAEPLLHAAHRVALKLELVLQPLGPDALLAQRALFPAVLRTLIATDVDELRGKEFEHLGEDVLQKLERRLLARAEDLFADAPAPAHLVALALAAQPRIGGERCDGMPRKLDFGNHRDIAVGGVFHDLADLLLRVIAAVRRLVILARGVMVADERLPAHRSHARQLGVFFDLDTPALIVGQVPVELVELVHGEDVDILLDLVHRPEMTAGIEHAPAVGEIGFVADRHGGHDAFAVDNQLAQALQAVEDALRRSAAHLDARRSHGERIGLGLQRAVHRQTDVALGGGFHHPSDDRRDLPGENPGRAAQFGILADADHGRRGYGERPRAGCHREGFGNDVDLGSRPEGRARQTDGAQRKKESLHIDSGYG